jgi:SulP family sulfate permease
VHALVLAAIVYAAAPLVGRIPLVALAGVLLVTAYRMVERHSVRAVLSSTRGDALVFALTAAATVAFDLLVAVELGLALAIVLALVHVARTARAVPEPVDSDGIYTDVEHELLTRHVLVYRLDGPLFFAGAGRFLAEVTTTADVRVVILRLASVAMLDATAARSLGEIVRQLEDRGIIVLVKGASAEHERLLTAVGALAPVAARGHVFATLPEAVAHAADHLTDEAGSRSRDVTSREAASVRG